MNTYEFFLSSSLEKVFPATRPRPLPEDAALSVWRGTRASLQLVYYSETSNTGMPVQTFLVEVAGSPFPALLQSVELLPSDYPCYEDGDDNYITKAPGMFPDLLMPLKDHRITPLPRQYRSLWITIVIPESAEPGDYAITIKALPDEKILMPNGASYQDPDVKNYSFTGRLLLHVGTSKLPPQRLLHTEWFHTDCLSAYYHVEPFSPEHWEIIDHFLHEAARHGINMILTPVFTPPLDTAVGGERLTTQLVGIYLNGGEYTFDFTRLAQWALLCRKNQITHLEISHLFTQWGARFTPKIIVTADGVEKQLFGWEVPADSKQYRTFLEALIPALKKELKDLGFDEEHVYYHISDEPSEEHLDSYRTALSQVKDLLKGCQVMDALSSFEFYKHGIIRQPVTANDHIGPFLEAGVSDLWVYYCCVQGNKVPNRFYSMPSARNRIMGVLMYLYRIKGFLHWGYNFYNSKYSYFPIDPFATTHADHAFPSGDPYLVYPGKDGRPLSSIRAEVQDDALFDLRALELLESLAGREFTENLIYEDAAMRTMTFTDYPTDSGYLLNLREKLGAEIEKRGKKTT